MQKAWNRQIHPGIAAGTLAFILALITFLSWPPTKSQHIVILILDTVRADHLSLYGYSRETTPYLNSLAPSSLVFTRAKAPSPWTVPSHASLFTALWPAEHRAVWGHARLDATHLTLAEVLRDQGFLTAGYSANGFVSEWNNMAQGFQIFNYVDAPEAVRSKTLLAKIAPLLDHVVDKKQNLFLFVNLLDAHIPYTSGPYGKAFGLEGAGPIEDHDRKWSINAGEIHLSAKEQKQHAAAYDAAIRYLDDAVRELTGMLKARGMYRDTLFVVTADHGEGLGAHAEIDHTLSVWEEQLAIPLLIHLPGDERGGERYTGLTSLTGLAPSLLDWAGVPRPEKWRGRPNLFEVDAAGITANYRSYFSDHFLAVNQEVAKKWPELSARIHHAHVLYCKNLKRIERADGEIRIFDLASDPDEQYPLAQDKSPEAMECGKRYKTLKTQGRFIPFEMNFEPQKAPSEQEMEIIRSLGYIQ